MNNEGRTTLRCPIDQKLGGLAFGGREGPTHTFFYPLYSLLGKEESGCRQPLPVDGRKRDEGGKKPGRSGRAHGERGVRSHFLQTRESETRIAKQKPCGETSERGRRARGRRDLPFEITNPPSPGEIYPTSSLGPPAVSSLGDR